MKLETSYARALYGAKASAKSDLLFKNLKSALTRRGHQKLLPSIFAEYEKLVLHEARIKRFTTPTKESERTRVLLELYRKLVSTT